MDQELLNNSTLDPHSVLDLIGERLNMSVDELGAVLEAFNTAAYAMELNMQQLFDDHMDEDLHELGMFDDVVAALDSED